jgi:5'-AMP-activated protein kinase catalytic alpha subunit
MKRNADVPNNQGIIIGYNRIPVDPVVITKLSTKEYDPEYVIKCVEANRHNDATTAYYLTLKQHLKEGGSSPCDMSSHNFDKNLIEPVKRQE